MQLSRANLETLNRETTATHLNMEISVLVIGAGELGLSVLQALAMHPKISGSKVSVLLRQATMDSAAPQKRKTVQKIKAMGVQFEPADVVEASVDDLAAIFSKFDTVVGCTGMELPPGTQTKFTKAVIASKARRYIPWQWGMDYDVVGQGSSQDLFDEQISVRNMLREHQSETEWVIVSTGLFMGFLFLESFGVVDLSTRTVRALGSWQTEITVTSVNDIGRAAAEVLLDPKEVKNQCIYVAGDTITYEKLADLLDAHFGKPFKRELWDLETLKRQMEGDPNAMVKYRDTFAQGKGVAWPVEKTFNAERGMKMVDVKTYLETKGLKIPADVE